MTEMVTPTPLTRLHSIARQLLKHAAGEAFYLDPEHPLGEVAIAMLGTDKVRLIAIHVSKLSIDNETEVSDFCSETHAIHFHVAAIDPKPSKQGMAQILPPQAFRR